MYDPKFLPTHINDEKYLVLTDNTVPCWVVLLVELLLDESSNILFNVELLQGLGRNVNRVLLHIFGHVCILDYCLPVCHSLQILMEI